MPPTTEIGLSENLFCKKVNVRLPVALYFHLCKYEYLIYGAIKVQTSRKTIKINLPVNKLELRAFTNSRKAETLSYERKLINKSSEIFIFSEFHFTTKYFIMFGTVVRTKDPAGLRTFKLKSKNGKSVAIEKCRENIRYNT